MTGLVKKEQNQSLTTHDSQSEAERIDLIKRTVCKGATNEELGLFLQVCKRTGLDPFSRQIYAVKRWDSKERREVMTSQFSIDGFRLVAERSGRYAGQLGPYWCGADGVWTDIWLKKEYPFAAKVGVIRSDFKETLWAVARFDAYVQKNKDGQVTKFWAQMPDLMIGKVAEALALRRGFPMELSGCYTAEEMAQANNPGKIVESAEDSEPDVVEAVVEKESKQISRPEAELGERQQKVLAAFLPLGVDRDALEIEIGKDMTGFTSADFDALKRLYTDVRSGKRTSGSPDSAVNKLQSKFG